MKELTKYSRLAQYLEKLFNMLNEDFFDGVLERPVISIQSTPRAYGHYVLADIWNVNGEGCREINIGAGTLDRPIEETVATLLHEMCHMLADTILHTQDCSRGGTYHNRTFKRIAEEHGLYVQRSEKYGWAHTSPSDELIDWILNNNIQEIKLNRCEAYGLCEGGRETGTTVPPTSRRTARNNSRRYVCPCCGAIVRATRSVNLICGDCVEIMLEG